MTRKKTISSPEDPKIIAEVGGLVDEARVTRGVYGPDLDPEEISTALNCAPTSAHRRGDARGPRRPGWAKGAWLLAVEGRSPVGPDEILDRLLGRLPDDPGVLRRLAAKYSVRVRFGLFVGEWNRGFELSPRSIERLAALGVSVGFDMYADPGRDRE